MASTKELRKRIGTVKNTQQTTKAMKMVSAAKLRRAQDAIIYHRPYAKKVDDLLKRLLQVGSESIHSPFLVKEVDESAGKKGHLLLVLVSSDRGLCGGFNSNIVKTSERWLRANQENYDKVTLAFVGKKANDYFKIRMSGLGPLWTEVSGKVTFAKARVFADLMLEGYKSAQFTEVKIIYNEFKNAVTQKVVVEDFLPLVAKPVVNKTQSEEQKGDLVIVKPSLTEMANEILDKYFAIQSFRIMLESQASEHGARMSAMENATKNAGEMMKALTLEYNKSRQAGITKELLEIIGGSEAQKAS